MLVALSLLSVIHATVLSPVGVTCPIRLYVLLAMGPAVAPAPRMDSDVFGGAGAGGGMTNRRLRTRSSLMWKIVNFGAEAADFFSGGAKSGPKSRKNFENFKKCCEAHQTDQRNVLNAYMARV